MTSSSVSGFITADDYLSALRLHHRRTRARNRFFLLLVGVAGTAVMALMLTQVMPGPILPAAIAMGWGFGGLIGDWILLRFQLPRKARRLHAQHKSFALRTTYGWTSDGLHAENESGQSTLAWSDYVRRNEDEQVLLLYQTDVLFQMLPKRWFADGVLPASLKLELDRVPSA